jgi:hypothetical protein
LRNRYFVNRYFDTLEEAMKQADLGLNEMKKERRKALKSLTNWPWINVISKTT